MRTGRSVPVVGRRHADVGADCLDPLRHDVRRAVPAVDVTGEHDQLIRQCARRHFANTFGQTMVCTSPVSSSIVTNTVPS